MTIPRKRNTALAGAVAPASKAPRPLAICATPRVFVVDGFASDREMDAVRAVPADRERLAKLGIPITRTVAGLSFEMPVAHYRVLGAFANRIERAFGMRDDLGDSFRFRRYKRSEYHPPHLDTYEIEGKTLVFTAMLCLTDVALGGETHFPRARPYPLRIAPKRGRLIVWFNHLRDGRVDRASLHESLPLLRGVKETITTFVYKPLAACATDVDADGVILPRADRAARAPSAAKPRARRDR